MDDKLKNINESQKKRIIIILDVWGGGGFETVVSTLMAKLQSVSVRISPGRMKPDSVDTVYTYFLGRVRTIFKYVFDN